MPAVSLEGHVSTGHGCFPPTSTESGFSSKTNVEGKACQLLGLTKYSVHSCGSSVHLSPSRITSSGSSKVNIEGKASVRIGDSIACGDTVAQGASKVFIGG
jgi:uncharacterized Zn-binding protein involved in type VI secretion